VTAFLQAKETKGQGADDLFDCVVPELAAALNCAPGVETAKIPKAIYGLSNAPRNFWMDVRKNLRAIGALEMVGDPCTWVISKPQY